MYYRDLIYVGVDNVLQRQMYASAANGRPRLISLLSGGLLGVSQVLPAENILQNAERFKFDVVEPSINRWSSYFANRHISSTPTLRSMTLGMVDLRLALAHNPTSLKSPLPTLSFLAGKKDIALFPDNALEIFRRLNVSPFDVELKYLFKSFVEADANLYQTTMNGIQTYCRRNYTRVNGTQIPLPSITEEELTIIAASYLGILIAYVLPLPTTPVDNYQMYWATNILPQVFALVDQFNERSVIDTKQIENVAKFIYIMRYQVIHAPHKIAEELVEIQLTDPWSNLPPVMLGLNRELVHELADDIEDILEDSMEKEQNPFEDRAIGHLPFYTDYGQMDQEIINCIEEDMDRLYELQEHYAYRALNENEILSLESLHARYYYHIKPVHNLSLEDMQSGKHKNLSISTEAGSLLVVGAIAAAIAGAIAIIVKMFNYFTKSQKTEQQTDKQITETKASVDSNLKLITSNGAQNIIEIGDKLQEATKAGIKLTEDNFKKTRRMANIIARYNQEFKAPQKLETVELYRAVGNAINTREKLNSTILTRKDNSHCPQVPTFMFDRKAMDIFAKQTETLSGALNEVFLLSESLIDKTKLEQALRKQTFEFDIKRGRFLQNGLEQAKTLIEPVVDNLKVTGPVNTSDILELTFIDRLKITFGGDSKRTQKVINNLTRGRTESLKLIEDLVSKGIIDDDYAKRAGTTIKKTVQTAMDISIALSRAYSTYIRAGGTIARFFSDWNELVKYRKLFEDKDLVDSITRTVKVADAGEAIDKHMGDDYVRLEF